MLIDHGTGHPETARQQAVCETRQAVYV